MSTVNFLLINILIGVDTISPSFIGLLVNSLAVFFRKKKDLPILVILFLKFLLSLK